MVLEARGLVVARVRDPGAADLAASRVARSAQP